MPEVDPEDDSIWRWVLYHYRFDPARRERRNVIVAAYDNESEYQAALDAYGRQLRAEQDAGERERVERISGVIWHPGRHAEEARMRALRRAMKRGEDPRTVVLDGPLPSHVSFFGWDADGTTWSMGGGVPPEPPTTSGRTNQAGPRDGEGQ